MAWQAQGEHDGVRAQLHDYIYDYLVKMNYKDTAHAFADESKITTTADVQSRKNYDTLAASLDSIDKSGNDHHPQMSPHSNKKGAAPPAGLPHVNVPIDAPGGFLYEWWVIFWDIFTAKNNRSTNKDAMAYVEAQQRLKQQQMFSAFQQQQLMRLHHHAAQQVYQAQDQPSLRVNGPPGSQQIARGQTSEDMMIDTNAQASENTPNSKRSQEEPGLMSSPSPTASPNKRQRLSPPDGIQIAASNATDEQQQQAAMMNRRRASLQGLQAGAAAAAAANKQQTGQTPRMTALSLQQQMLQNQYQMNIRSIQNSNISEAQKQSAILQYKEKLVNQQKMAMADAAVNQSSAAGATASPKNQNVTAAMLPPNMPQAQVASNPQVPGTIPGGQPGMPLNQLQYQQMLMEQQKRNQQMMMGRMSQQNMQPGMMGMSPRSQQQQPGGMSPAPNASTPGQPGGRNTPHISSQVLPSPSIVASNTTPGGNMQGGQFVATSGGQDMNNVSDQIKASQMDLEKRIAMTHAPMNAGVTGSAGPPGGPPKAPVGHMMARAPMMAGYPGMGHPATMGMMNGMMPGVVGMAGMPAGMMAGMPGGQAVRGVAPQATNAAQFMQQQQQMYNMGMVQARGPEAQMRAQQAQIAQQAQAAAAMALRNNRPPPQANGLQQQQQQQANAKQMAMNNAAANAATTPASKPSDASKPKASPAAKSNQAKAAAANTPSATPVPTQIVSPEQAAVSKPADAPTPQQPANAAHIPNAAPTISSQDNKAAATAVSKPMDNRNNETSNFLTDDPLMFDNEVPLLDDNFDLDVFFNNTDEYSFNQT